MSQQLMEEALVEMSKHWDVEVLEPGICAPQPQPDPTVPLRGGLKTQLWASRAEGLRRTDAPSVRLRRRMMVCCSDDLAVASTVIALSDDERFILDLVGG